MKMTAWTFCNELEKRGFVYPGFATDGQEILDDLEDNKLMVFKAWYKDSYLRHYNQANYDKKMKMIKRAVEYILVQEGLDN